MKRTIAALAAVAVAVLGTFAFASPAMATDPDPYYAEVPATAWDWVGAYNPEMEPEAATLSTVSCGAVENPELKKPDTGGETILYPPTSNGDTGTSIETPNLGLAVAAGDKLTVGATFSDGATGDAGAVRMFVYDTTDADTLNTKPTFAGVTGNVDPTRSEYVWPGQGVGEITFTQAGTIGTFGLTYDASNDSEGTITFSGLRLVKADGSEVHISLCAKPQPPATETTTEPAATTTTAAAPTLPVTGSGLTGLVAVAGVLLVAGAAVVVVARRRRA